MKNHESNPKKTIGTKRGRRLLTNPVPGNDLAQIGLSLGVRLVQFAQGPVKPEHRLEQVWIGLAGVPATKELNRQLLTMLNQSSDGQWRSAVTCWLACCADPANNRYLENPHLVKSWRPMAEAANGLLRDNHIEIDRLEYSRQLRPLVKRQLSLLSRKSTPDTSWMRGIFTTEASQTAETMRRQITTIYGERVLTWLDQTRKYIQKKVLSSPVMRIALEIMDEQARLAEPSIVTELAYQKIESWVRIWYGPKNGHTKLYFPGAMEFDEYDRPTWNEEARVGLTTFSEAFQRRIRLDAAGVVEDFQDGLLIGYLRNATRNGIVSEIRHRTTMKESGGKSDGNPSESPEEGSQELYFEPAIPPVDALPDTSIRFIEDIENTERYETLVSPLDPFERKMFDLRFVKGKTLEGIGKDLSLTKGCISKKMDAALEKLRVSGVAKLLQAQPET